MLMHLAEVDQRARHRPAHEGVFEKQLAPVVPVTPIPHVEQPRRLLHEQPSRPAQLVVSIIESKSHDEIIARLFAGLRPGSRPAVVLATKAARRWARSRSVKGPGGVSCGMQCFSCGSALSATGPTGPFFTLTGGDAK